MNKKKLPLAFWIFIGLVVGIAVGLALMMVPNGLDIAKNYILPWGTIFLNLLKFIVVPIVLFSIASGVISMQDIGRVGSVGGKTIVYYMCTTAFAVVLALVLASAAKGMHIFAAMETSGLAYEPPAGQSLMQTSSTSSPPTPSRRWPMPPCSRSSSSLSWWASASCWRGKRGWWPPRWWTASMRCP